MQVATRGSQERRLYKQGTILKSFFEPRPFESEDDLVSLVQGEKDLLMFVKQQNERRMHEFSEKPGKQSRNNPNTVWQETLATERKLLTTVSNNAFASSLEELGSLDTIPITKPSPNKALRNKVIPELVPSRDQNVLDFRQNANDSMLSQVGTSPHFVIKTEEHSVKSKRDQPDE